jgi:hypothetical protein
MSSTDTTPDLPFEALLDDPSCQAADARAVMDSLIAGVPLDPKVSRRVSVRAEKIRNEIFRKHGYLNIAVDLIREGREEE